MRTHHTAFTLALALLVVAMPAASAAALRLPVSPLRLPAVPSSSSSSASSESSSSSTSSSSSASATAKPQSAANKLTKGNGVHEYCMAVSLALAKAAKVKADEETMKKVDQSVDLLTKAQAICASMGFVPPVIFQDGTFSSSGGATFTPVDGTFSSSGGSATVETESQFCTVTGKAGKRGGVQMCRYDCGGKAKIMICQ